MRTMKFLIRLLISEVKRLDPDPDNNIIIRQCDDILEEMDSREHMSAVLPAKNGKSGVLRSVEHTAEVADQAVKKVKAAEEGDK